VMGFFRRVVTCSNPVKYIDFHVSSGMLSFIGRTINDPRSRDNGKELPLYQIVDVDPKKVVFDIKGQAGVPIFGPEQSLVVHVYSAVGPITIKSIEVGPK